MTKQYQILFHTHTGAIRFDREHRAACLSLVSMPVPRVLSSNCSVSFLIEYDGDIQTLIDEQIDKVFIKEGEKYELIYDCDE